MTILRVLLFTILASAGIAPVTLAAVIDSVQYHPLSPIADTTNHNHISIGWGFSVSPISQNVSTTPQTNLSHGMSTDFLVRYSIRPRYAVVSSLSLISHGHHDDKDNPYFLGISAVFQTRITGDDTHGLTVAIGPRISYTISLAASSYPTIFQHLLTEAMGRIGYEMTTDGSIYAFGIESTYFLTESESNVRLITASAFFHYYF